MLEHQATVELYQLVMLMPKMDFSVLSWIFYFAVSALTILLAWRDKLLFPLVALALVLAIGLVVDDVIIVVENVNRHLEDGKTPMESAILAGQELGGPIIAIWRRF